jgi:hypothetical protein
LTAEFVALFCRVAPQTFHEFEVYTFLRVKVQFEEEEAGERESS